MRDHDKRLPAAIALIICHKRLLTGNTRTSKWSADNYKFPTQPLAFEFWANRKDPKGRIPDSITFTDGSSYVDNNGIIRYR